MKDVSFSWNECMCNAEDRFSVCKSFFAEQVMLGFNAQNH